MAPRGCAGCRGPPKLIDGTGAIMVHRRGQRTRQPPVIRRRFLGRSQVVRQRILIPPCGGSNPPAPANDNSLNSLRKLVLPKQPRWCHSAQSFISRATSLATIFRGCRIWISKGVRRSQLCADWRNASLYSGVRRLWRHHPCKSVLVVERRLRGLGDCRPYQHHKSERSTRDCKWCSRRTADNLQRAFELVRQQQRSFHV